METCKFKMNQLVCFKLDTNPNHQYKVVGVTPVPDLNTCEYNIESTTENILLAGVPESYMTDTVDGKDTITLTP